MSLNFADLRATVINCSLQSEAQLSHTDRLLDRVSHVLEVEGVSVDRIHALEHTIAFGMHEDMTEHGAERDDWPALHDRVVRSDIFVLGTPIWLGVKSSVATLVIERMYAYSAEQNEAGQYVYYNKVGGCAVTGNEDGIKACARDVLYSLQHIGYAIPPQADCGWIGEAGPGPSYGDVGERSEPPMGFDNDFTNKNATFMAWNLMHLARILKDVGGIPPMGNTVDGWRQTTNAAEFEPAAIAPASGN